MNPRLSQLQSYPFEKLPRLMAYIKPATDLKEMRHTIGEPQHATPAFISAAFTAGLARQTNYPSTSGLPAMYLAHQPPLAAMEFARAATPI